MTPENEVLESRVMADIADFLNRKGWVWTISDAAAAMKGKGRSRRTVVNGWPDITVILPDGRFFAIEAKRPQGGKLGYYQAVMLKRMYDSNALVCLARDLCDVEAAIVSGETAPWDMDEIRQRIEKGPNGPRKRNTRKSGAVASGIQGKVRSNQGTTA